MPKDFDMCRSKGGMIRTKKMDKMHYQHMCTLDGKVYMGEVREYKKILKGSKK